MARQAVIQITCSRCTRVEHRPMADAHLLKETKVVFSGEFKGQKISYDDLCTTCEAIVDTHWKEITKSLTKASPTHQKGRTRKHAEKSPVKPT